MCVCELSSVRVCVRGHVCVYVWFAHEIGITQSYIIITV